MVLPCQFTKPFFDFLLAGSAIEIEYTVIIFVGHALTDYLINLGGGACTQRGLFGDGADLTSGILAVSVEGLKLLIASVTSPGNFVVSAGDDALLFAVGLAGAIIELAAMLLPIACWAAGAGMGDCWAGDAGVV